MRVRFAPSPTGFLHLGNIRLAIINEILAKKFNGSFVLRIDNTDVQRSKALYVDYILKDFSWLDIHPDETYYQHERMHLYAKAKDYLLTKKRIYPCFETEEELSLKRSVSLSQGKPPIYDRSALSLTKDQIDQYLIEGRKPYYRFLLNPEKVDWIDMNIGQMEIDPTFMSDPVLFREDGTPLYTLTSVVDDIDLEISHIIRGIDHVSNTAIQIQLFHTLFGMYEQEKELPYFCHISLIHNEDGEVLSKRQNSLSLRDLRHKGYAPYAIKLFFAYLGTSSMPTGMENWNEVIQKFQIQDLGQSDIKFQISDIKRLSGKIYSEQSWKLVQHWFSDYSENVTEDLWNLVKYNILILMDVITWYKRFKSSKEMDVVKVLETLKPYFNTLPLFQSLIQQLEKLDTHESIPWHAICTILQNQFHIKGKELFAPLRIAITGVDDGPKLDLIVHYLGKQFIIQRLQYILDHQYEAEAIDS